MLNPRKQIGDALATIISNVKQTRPEGDEVFPLITYAETQNYNINKFEDRIEYQVDAYANTNEEVIELSLQIDEVMTGLGWHRTNATPDTQTRQAKDFYKKSATYTARVDTFLKNITGGF